MQDEDVGLATLQRAAVRVINGYCARFGVTRDVAFHLGERSAARLKLNG